MAPLVFKTSCGQIKLSVVGSIPTPSARETAAGRRPPRRNAIHDKEPTVGTQERFRLTRGVRAAG